MRTVKTIDAGLPKDNLPSKNNQKINQPIKKQPEDNLVRENNVDIPSADSTSVFIDRYNMQKHLISCEAYY